MSTIGDLDGDGLADVVTADSQTAVVLHPGNGDGTVQAAPSLGPTVTGIRGLAVGDWNRDGRADLAVVGSSAVVLLAKPGNLFAAPVRYPLAGSATNLRVDDFNGDGLIDLGTATASSLISVVLGRGDGTFGPSIAVYGGRNLVAAAAGDFNGDKRIDLAALSVRDGTANVILNTGSVPFSLAFTSPTGFGGNQEPGVVVAADFNGDGKRDLAVGNRVSKDVSILIGDGGGTFGAPTHFPVGQVPWRLIAADFNNDGRPDPALSMRDGPQIGVFIGKGDGSLLPMANYAALASGAPLTAGDLNGDQRPDLIAGAGNLTQVFLATGNGTFQAGNRYNGGGPAAIAGGDFNGDGAVDVLSTDFTTNLWWSAGNGDGTLQVGKNVQANLANASQASLVAADYDGDGKLDLAVLGGAVQVVLGRGDGTFLPPRTHGGGSGSTFGAAADLTGDGKPELVLANLADGLTTLINKGDGTFPFGFSLLCRTRGSVAPGDFNGDKKIDLAAIATLDGVVNVYLAR